MYYLKTFFLNAFFVFFANYVLPGVEVTSMTKLPHIGWDIIFAALLGAINSFIYPILKLFSQVSMMKILGVSFVINFLVYAILKLLPIGIHIVSLTGYFMVAFVVSIASFLINFFEMRHKKRQGHCENTLPPENL